MTVAKYTPEERLKIRQKWGKINGTNQKFSPERRAKISLCSKKFQAEMTQEQRDRISNLHSESAKKQMKDPCARANISEHRKKFWKDRGYKPICEMTDEMKKKISDAQTGRPKEWVKDKDKLTQFRLAHANRWFLISPRGVSYDFEGLPMFVESHPDLFSEYQREKTSKANIPRACHTMTFLSPKRSRVAKVSQGWVWDYDAEMAAFKSNENNYNRVAG